MYEYDDDDDDDDDVDDDDDDDDDDDITCRRLTPLELKPCLAVGLAVPSPASSKTSGLASNS